MVFTSPSGVFQDRSLAYVLPSEFTKDGEKQTPSTELGPPDRIVWLDELPDREARPEEQKDPTHCCEIRRKLADQFATAARLYAEAVVAFTSPPTISLDEYKRLRKAAEEARKRAETIEVAYEEHVASHRCQGESLP